MEGRPPPIHLGEKERSIPAARLRLLVADPVELAWREKTWERTLSWADCWEERMAMVEMEMAVVVMAMNLMLGMVLYYICEADGMHCIGYDGSKIRPADIDD
jgi:hypothetical protein